MQDMSGLHQDTKKSLPAPAWREDFPILTSEVYGKPLVYLDSAATSQMPRQVMDRLARYYAREHANVHRGIHFLSETATASVENVRRRAAAWIGASSPEEIIFTSGATDSLNMAASGLTRHLRAETSGRAGAPADRPAVSGEPGFPADRPAVFGDPGRPAIVVTDLEHHSNFVPWQQLCRLAGLCFCVCPSEDGNLRLDLLEQLLLEYDVRIVAVTQVSNVTGTVMPLSEIISLSHRYGAEVVVDGAQGILHEGVDVAALDIDCYAFSAHKMLGPTGIGVLYGKRTFLEKLTPVRTGGGMVNRVTAEETTWNDLPYRLEAGTPNIAGIIGLGEAIEYIENHRPEEMRSYEKSLLDYAVSQLSAIEGLRILGHPAERSGIISFNLDGIQAYDAAFLLDKLGIAVRSGHHCAEPALRSLGAETAVRASFAFYNTKEDVDALCGGIQKVRSVIR